MILAGFILASLASAAQDGWHVSGSIGAGTGWDSDPLRVPASEADPGATLRLEGKNVTGWRSGRLDLAVATSGTLLAVPGAQLAGDDEILLEPSAKLSGGGHFHPWAEFRLHLLASDNSLLVGSERFDPQGERQGELARGIGAAMGVRARHWGRFAIEGDFVDRDFEELAASTSLDRRQWEARFGWDGPKWGWVSLESAIDAEDRLYRSWPARYRWGDAAPGVAKHITSFGAEAGATFEPDESWRLRAKGRLVSREDRAWGYFDEIAPSMTLSARWRPDSCWTLQVRAQEGLELFATYRDGYDPASELKRIHSSLFRIDASRAFGSRSLGTSISRVSERNTNPRYTWTAWSVGIRLLQEY